MLIDTLMGIIYTAVLKSIVFDYQEESYEHAIFDKFCISGLHCAEFNAILGSWVTVYR